MDSIHQIKQLEEKAFALRKKVLDMCIAAGTGHVTSCFSCAEILTALYYGEVLNYKHSDPQWDNRDRFILSKGQASPILYAILEDCGFITEKNFNSFCQTDGACGVHLQHDIPGAEITAGSLGVGLGIAAGMALAAKIDEKTYKVISMIGDGECYEGSIWETVMFAAHHKLNNLLVFIDRNQLCVTGATESIVKLDPLDEKFKAFGWEAVIIDGHSIECILHEINHFKSTVIDKPLAVIANTVKGKGIPFIEDQPLWHGVAPQGDEAERARQELEENKQD